MKAIVCGAGIAGLTVAWHLERAGWEVELVEHAPAFREGGYMIDFYGPGLEVAERMGLRPRLEEVRHPVHEIGFLDRDGRQTSRLAVKAGFAGVISLLRGDLARVLAEEVRAPVRYGTTVASVRQDGGGAEVDLTDGTRHEVDLLIGTDGVHSRVRELVFGPEDRFVRYLGHHVAAYVLHDEDLGRRVGTRYRMLTEPGLMAGAYAVRGGGLALLFLSREPGPALPDDPAGFLRQRFGHLGWILPEVLDRCPRPPALYYDQVTQIEAGRWSDGRVVLLGDSCQAVSLFAGHGASLAMAAARALADELGTVSLGTGELGTAAPGDLSPALARYAARMRPVAARVQASGRRFLPWMAPSGRLRMATRDLLLRLASLPGADRLFMDVFSPGGHHLVR
ncbi:NAD(P)-binding protein [Microbispora cellulosiformans]|uniref:NAD(P)-binding protein n=1 Tax=Microbispora cellulosiformans TaxID=2614688 RepID=A0A5J5K4W1_9ACTN|nr:FAD-dependent oxidoreductase [Microbispora cellulosiformans]KAA9378485.1 NAD(P)-binding protein [Microbispora cellulosiformans]